jgi:hypothetical protein
MEHVGEGEGDRWRLCDGSGSADEIVGAGTSGEVGASVGWGRRMDW